MAKKPFPNYIYYLQNEFRPLSELPFNEVDSAIFSWLSYLCFEADFKTTCTREGMPLMDLLNGRYHKKLFRTVYWQEETKSLFFALLSNPRFQKTKVSCHCDINNLDTSLQFSATIFSFSETQHYVGFRGTDKTIHGWKEDALLLLHHAAPGQKASVEYLNEAGTTLPGELIVGGHSKGGHLAVYAAAHCEKEVQDRITAVYSHDGPGFLKQDAEHPGMKAIASKIHKTIPESSLVGLIFENETQPDFIKSNQIGPLQHYLGSWEVDGHAFVRIPSKEISDFFVINNLNEWAETASRQELEDFLKGLFEIIEVTGVDDLDEIRRRPLHFTLLIARRYYRIDKDKRSLIRNTFRRILYGKNVQRFLSFLDHEKDTEEAKGVKPKIKKVFSTILLVLCCIIGFVGSQLIGYRYFNGNFFIRLLIWALIYLFILCIYQTFRKIIFRKKNE